MGKVRTPLEQQIRFVHDARKLLEKEQDIQIVWMEDSIPVLMDVEENLIALRNIAHVQGKDDQLVDTSLQGCLDFVRREKKWNELQLEELGDKRLRMLNAIEENLCAMQILAERMAEQLAKLPENSLREAEGHG